MISAQDAFEKAQKQIIHLDTTDVLQKVEERILSAIAFGTMATYSEPILNLPLAEKSALQLQNLGYCVTVLNGPQIISDGKPENSAVLSVNWKYVQSGVRESYQNPL